MNKKTLIGIADSLGLQLYSIENGEGVIRLSITSPITLHRIQLVSLLNFTDFIGIYPMGLNCIVVVFKLD